MEGQEEGREKRAKDGRRGKRKGEEGKGRKREKEGRRGRKRERVEYFGTREVGPNPSRMFIV